MSSNTSFGYLTSTLFEVSTFSGEVQKDPFQITEINLFVGKDFIQYILSGNQTESLETKWKEIIVNFEDFKLAPWEREFRFDKLVGINDPERVDLSNVTGFGFDIKTFRQPIVEKIWIDFIRLIHNNEIGENVIYDFEAPEVMDMGKIFKGKKIAWRTGAQKYRSY